MHHTAWTIASLGDELDKAASLLASNQKSKVRFYSRSPFGALGKLREHSETQVNEAEYLANLSQSNKKTDIDLSARLTTQSAYISTYDFLRRTSFEISNELDRMQELLYERLYNLTSNHENVYDALWTRLDYLGGRMSSANGAPQHRLTKYDLKDIVHHAGGMLAPVMDVMEIRKSFARTSAIGRSWHRNISGETIPSPVVDEILAAIYAKKKSILLTGLPGSGKTCVMLAVQEALELHAKTDSGLLPLFIQSREFADLASPQERQAQGLSEKWLEEVARMAEDAHVVVIVDSLDVLSISREHKVLTYFLAQIDQMLSLTNVTVVTACRDFDRQYDRRIAERKWDQEFKCQPLNWKSEIVLLLTTLGIHTATIDAVTRELIQNPRELALFTELAIKEGGFSVVTSLELAQRYLDHRACQRCIR